MSKRVKYAMIKVMDEWQTYANGGWRQGKWMDYEDSIAAKLANVLHVDQKDVGIALSLTSGMHSLMATLYKPNSKRFKIIMLESEFNSDIIAAESWLDINQARDGLLLAKISDKDPQVAVNNVLKLIEEHQESVSLVAMSLVSSHFSHYYDLIQIR